MTGSVTFVDQYSNVGSGSITVGIVTNGREIAKSFTNNTTFLNSNKERPSNKLLTISFTDVE